MATRNSWGSIRKLPSGRYQARYTHAGRSYKAPMTFVKKRVAQAWLAKEQARLNQEAAGIAQPEEEPALLNGSKTIKQLSHAYLHFCEERGLAPATLRDYRSYMTKHINPPLGDIRCDELTETAIKQWDTSHNWPSHSRRKKAIDRLNALIVYGAKNGYLHHLKADLPTRRTRNKQRCTRTLSPAEISQLRELVPPEYAVMIDLAAWGALRFNEIQCLRRMDLDLSKGVVRVRRGISRGIGGQLIEGLPKTDAAQRDVTLPAECAKRVTEHMHTFVSKDKDALVVHMAGKPGAFLTNKSMHAWYDRAVTQLGYPGYRFHDLRHTGLTLYGRAGATLADLTARAGHSDVGAVMIYQHSAVERDRALAARMEKLGE